MKNKKLKVGILLIATLIATVGVYAIWADVGSKSTGLAGDNAGFSLVRPAFAQSMDPATSFLYQEAGMSIWLNATSHAPLNLTSAKKAMVNMETDMENATSGYVIGSLSDNGGITSSDDYPHCVVFASGWIVVYYLKVNTQNNGTTGWIGKIIDWTQYSNNKLNGTYLSEAMYYIAYTTLGLPTTNEQYFHFQYPSATELMFAIKHAPNGATETFNINVPDSANVSEYSWSCVSYGSSGYQQYIFKIDQNVTSQGRGRNYGGPEITPKILSPGSWHVVSITSTDPYLDGGNDVYVCLILLYS
mgnify:CR=1 FL=1